MDAKTARSLHKWGSIGLVALFVVDGVMDAHDGTLTTRSLVVDAAIIALLLLGLIQPRKSAK